MADQNVRILCSSLRLDKPDRHPDLLDVLGDDMDDMLYGSLTDDGDGDDAA